MQPILFDFGLVQIRWYGLMYALALLIGVRLITDELKRLQIKFNEDQVFNIIVGTFFGGILGARLYYVLFNLSYYRANPAEIPAVWHGGLAIHGGIIFGFLTGYLLVRKSGLPIWKFADAAAPAVLFGQVLGRFGNFMNGDAHGLPTNLPWGVVFPLGTPAGDQFPGLPLHPVMVYELILNLIFFLILRRLRFAKYRPGFILCMYFIAYAVSRFICSFFRADDLLLFGMYNMPHIISVLMLSGSIFCIVRYRLYQKE